MTSAWGAQLVTRGARGDVLALDAIERWRLQVEQSEVEQSEEWS